MRTLPNGHKTIPNIDPGDGTYTSTPQDRAAYAAGWVAAADQIMFGIERHGYAEMAWFVERVKECIENA